jgi:hypothetical protein
LCIIFRRRVLMIRHVAMFQWREGTSEEQRKEARDGLASLKERCPTVADYTVGFDIGRNPRNWDMVLVADFDDVGALESYFNHPAHNEVAAMVDEATQPDITARVQFEY